MRETIFNVLTHRLAGRLEGARVLDLFAGSGALGFEALSRGASFAEFVELSAQARAAIARNAATLGVGNAVRVARRDATRLGPCDATPFDLIFADPPYGRGLGHRAIANARAGGWLASDALAVLEEAAGAHDAGLDGFERLDLRRAGEGAFALYRLVSQPDARAAAPDNA